MTSYQAYGDKVTGIDAELVILNQPISFWGGLNGFTGQVTDDNQDSFNEFVSGKILLVNGIKGSTASPGVLLELLMGESRPLGIISTQFEPVIYSSIAMCQFLSSVEKSSCPFYQNLAIDDVIKNYSHISISNNLIRLS